jgi:hypothetical protein
MNELWRRLRVGDRVRVTAWPAEMSEDRVHPDTTAAYRWLIETGTVLTITEIDEWGLPFGRYRRTIDAVECTEYMALNHGEVEVVEQMEEK